MENDSALSTQHSALSTQHPPPPSTAAEAGLRLAAAVRTLWITRHYRDEGRRCLEAALSAPQADERTSARACALFAAAALALVQSDYVAARRRGEESLAIYEELGDRRGMARALNVLSPLSASREEAQRLAARSLALFRECDDPAGTATALTRLSSIAHADRDYDTARAYHREALTIARSIGDRMLPARSQRCARVSYSFSLRGRKVKMIGNPG